jgi:2-phospho-L-lactate transferase/gluconeogenesis factor (CofD/UPF0052 family)
MEEIREAIMQLIGAKADKIVAESKIEEAQALLVKIAEREQTKALSSDIGGKTVNATVVSTERISYDEKALKKALGEKWKSIRSEKVDNTKLKAAITQGMVDASLVSKHAQITKSKPYVRISVQDTTQQPDS